MARKDLIQHRRDTAANWTSVNPVLAASELGFETDTNKFKLGDGTSTWTALAYQGGGGSGVSLTPSATQTIVAQNATTTPLALKGATSQSANLFIINTATTNGVLTVNNVGGLTVGASVLASNSPSLAFNRPSADGGTTSAPSPGFFFWDSRALSFVPVTNFTSNGGTSPRAIVQHAHYEMLTSAKSLASSTAVQDLFNRIQIQELTTYEFEYGVYLSTGTTPHTINLTHFNGGSSNPISSIFWESTFVNLTVAGTPASPVNIYNNATTATTISPTGMTTSTKFFKVKGIVRFGNFSVSGAGSFQFVPQITFSAAPGGTNQVNVNSYFKMSPIGTDTFTNTGTGA